MSTYRVFLATSASTVVVVEADDQEAAEQAAIDAETPTLCAQCSGWGRGGQNLELGDEWEIVEVTEES